MATTPVLDPKALEKAADKLLARARANDPGRPYGTVRAGDTLVTYSRIAKTYDVGTDAQSLAEGKRAAVLPVLLERLTAAAQAIGATP